MAGDGHGSRVTALALFGSEAWSGGGANGLILVHNVASGNLLFRLFTPHRTEEDRVLCFSSFNNGKHVWTGDSQGAIAVFSHEARSVQAEAEERQHGSAYTLCAIDNTSCWAGYADGSLILWRLTAISPQVQPSSSPLSSPSLCATARMTQSAAVRALALPALGGGLLWAALDDGAVLQLDSNTGRKVRNAGEGGAALLCIVPCGGGRVVCGGSADGSVYFFDAPSGRLLADVRAHSSRVTALTSDATGGVWSVSTDRTVRHWTDVPRYQTGATAAQCTGIPLEPCIGLLWAVASSSRTLVLGTGDGTLHFLPTVTDDAISSSPSLTSTSTDSSPSALGHTSLPVIVNASSAAASGGDGAELQVSGKEKNSDKEREAEMEKERQKEKAREAELLRYRDAEQERLRAVQVAEQARARALEAERSLMLEKEQREREQRQREREQERIAAPEREDRLKQLESNRVKALEEQQQSTERERERQREKDAEAEREREELRRLRAQLKETETELGAARAQCRRLEAQLSPPSASTLTTPHQPQLQQQLSPLANASSASPTVATPSLAPHTPITRTPTFSSSYSPDLVSPSLLAPSASMSSASSLSLAPRPAPVAANARNSPANPNSSASLAAAMAALNAERRALDARLDATCRQAAALRLN